MVDRLLVGTRGSKLALAQTKLVLGMLESADGGVSFEIVPIKTAGDLSPPGTLNLDGKTAFTGEIEEHLVDEKIDFAVHSMKDLPPIPDDRLTVAATPRRGDARDALVTTSGEKFAALRKGARVGTSSARRKAQILAAKKDVEVIELHGNVETRLRKLEAEALDGVVLAAAGLQRLGLGSRITQVFEPGEMVPAPCQGILAVQARRGDRKVVALLKKIDDPAARLASECERAFSEALGGDCDVPLGAFASLGPEGLTAIGVLACPDGSEIVKISATGGRGKAKELGRELASKVFASGGGKILRKLEG
ncbi:MAG: hydroxymethylbilane synthase [Nitrososphaerota archaeon]|nr:hydroxymethylbilane synthase [Nitrososphaerota archaeon]